MSSPPPKPSGNWRSDERRNPSPHDRHRACEAGGLAPWHPFVAAAFLFWLLLLPLAVLALPFLFIAAVIFGVRFWASIRAALAILAAFQGTKVEVENAKSRIFVNLH